MRLGIEHLQVGQLLARGTTCALPNQKDVGSTPGQLEQANQAKATVNAEQAHIAVRGGLRSNSPAPAREETRELGLSRVESSKHTRGARRVGSYSKASK